MNLLPIRHLVGTGALALAAALAGCASVRQTDPPVSATEQLLISTAVDRSVSQLQLPLRFGTKVFLDTTNLDIDATVVYPKYTIAVVRSQLLRMGAVMTLERKDADIVAELRSGAQSINDHTMLFGLPAFSLPVPLAGTLAIPEFPLFKYYRETGRSKVALAAYDRKGRLIADTGALYGEANQIHWVVLFFFSYTTNELHPE